MRSCLPHAQVETRIDSAFFNEVITERLHGSGVEFTLSVPFERFAALKGLVEGTRRWRRMHIPNWPEHRLRPLVEKFSQMLMEQRVYREIFGVI